MIVLVHSGISDGRIRDGFDVPGAVRHELRGFGDTPLPPAGAFSYTEDLLGRLNEPSTLVGASFGGLVCLDAAARRPTWWSGWSCSTPRCRITTGRRRSPSSGGGKTSCSSRESCMRRPP